MPNSSKLELIKFQEYLSSISPTQAILAFKIVEIVNEEIRTLFHGLDGSRVLQRSVWLEANVTIVTDGSSNTSYLAGWHTLPSKLAAEQYMTRFKNRREILQIIPCEIKDVWPKTHSPNPVMLSRFIKF